MIAALLSSMVSIGRSWRSIHQQLGLINILEINVFINATLHFILVTLSILEQRSLRDIKLPILVKEVLGCSRLSILTT